MPRRPGPAEQRVAIFRQQRDTAATVGDPLCLFKPPAEGHHGGHHATWSGEEQRGCPMVPWVQPRRHARHLPQRVHCVRALNVHAIGVVHDNSAVARMCPHHGVCQKRRVESSERGLFVKHLAVGDGEHVVELAHFPLVVDQHLFLALEDLRVRREVQPLRQHVQPQKSSRRHHQQFEQVERPVCRPSVPTAAGATGLRRAVRAAAGSLGVIGPPRAKPHPAEVPGQPSSGQPGACDGGPRGRPARGLLGQLREGWQWQCTDRTPNTLETTRGSTDECARRAPMRSIRHLSGHRQRGVPERRWQWYGRRDGG
mmetsp:Transcript_160/g.407  ORF Transcript_160/g.407 Transcript_160/m.407 type:complete len:312 (-) Transcript_160:98-1033(-)